MSEIDDAETNNKVQKQVMDQEIELVPMSERLPIKFCSVGFVVFRKFRYKVVLTRASHTLHRHVTIGMRAMID